MPRTLSWPGTFLMTRLFPAVWITGFGVGTLWLLVSPETIAWNGVRGGAPPGAGWLMLLAWLGGSAFVLFLSWGLKRVRPSSGLPRPSVAGSRSFPMVAPPGGSGEEGAVVKELRALVEQLRR
jgi:hypothetical protein